jgi:uncharacterized protein
MSALASRLALLQRQAGRHPAPIRNSSNNVIPANAGIQPFDSRRRAVIVEEELDPDAAAGRPVLSVSKGRDDDQERDPVTNAGNTGAIAATSLPTCDATIDTLRRLLGFRGRRVSLPAHAFDRDLPGEEIAPGVRLHEQRIAWPPPPMSLDLSCFGLEAIDASRLCFFDTETTGLAGGTGTRAFMLGAGDWHAGAFRVRQLTLTTMAGEAAMLDAFARWLAPDAVLVSYNGRSYDAPLLATRYRLARRASPLPGLLHLDLLHPTRRRYRGVWENCRLATIERHLLGVVREDDLPGSEAPRAWRDWLRGGSAHDLRRVGAHNRQDLCSLAGLLLRLAGDGAEPVTPRC